MDKIYLLIYQIELKIKVYTFLKIYTSKQNNTERLKNRRWQEKKLYRINTN